MTQSAFRKHALLGQALFSAGGSAPILDLPEAVLPMSYRQTLWLVGGMEYGIFFLICLSGNETLKFVSLLWLGLNFLVYRAFVVLLGVAKTCPCMGSVTQQIPLRPHTIDLLLKGVMWYLLIGSAFFLCANRFRGGPSGEEATRATRGRTVHP